MEEALWLELSVREKNLFRVVGIAFLFNMLLLATGSYVNLYLISSNLVITILAGTFLFLTLMGIVRFILAVIKRPPSDKQKESLPAESIAEVRSSQGLPHHKNPPKEPILKRLGYWFRFSNIIVVLLISAFGGITAIPLYVVFNKSDIESYNESLAEKNAEVWLAQKSDSFARTRIYQQQKLKDLEMEIASLEEKGIQSAYLLDKKSQLASLQKEELLARDTFNEELNIQYQAYIMSVKGKYFFAAIAIYVVSQKSFLPILIVVIFFFLIPAICLLWLKSGKSFQYFKRSSELFHKVIIEEYMIASAHESEVLRKKQNNNIQPLHKVGIWHDPPFNTSKKFSKKKRKAVDVNELLR